MSHTRRGSRLAAALTGLVLSAGVLAVAPGTAYAVDAPSGLSASANRIPVLSWGHVVGATLYDVEVSPSSTFSTTVVKVATLNEQYVPTAELPAGELWWRVRARSGSTLGDWTIASFDSRVDGAPEPIQPLPGTTFQAPQMPRFSWQPVAGATKYTVQTSPDPEFTDPSLIASSTAAPTAAYLVSFPRVGDYYWRVRAELGSGSTEWSPSSLYHAAGLPDARLTAPTDGFDDPVRDVVLDWEPVAGAVSYQLQVSTDANFLATAVSTTGITSTSYSPAGTLDNDEYYWRVRAVDGSGNASAWPATPWRFRRAWPDQPELVYPRGDLPADRPLFYEWNATERASSYLVTVSQVGGPWTCSFSTVHTTASDKCVPTSAGTYTWSVIATDQGGQNPITDVFAQTPASFTWTPPTVTPAPAEGLTAANGLAVAHTGTAAYGAGVARDVCTETVPLNCNLRQTPVLT